jgi:hypothetical protein
LQVIGSTYHAKVPTVRGLTNHIILQWAWQTQLRLVPPSLCFYIIPLSTFRSLAPDSSHLPTPSTCFISTDRERIFKFALHCLRPSTQAAICQSISVSARAVETTLVFIDWSSLRPTCPSTRHSTISFQFAASLQTFASVRAISFLSFWAIAASRKALNVPLRNLHWRQGGSTGRYHHFETYEGC